MAEQYVGKTAEFKDGDRRIIFAGENEIGVFRHEGAVLRLQQFLPAPGRPRLRRAHHRQGRGAPPARQDLARPLLLRQRDALRVPVARLRVRHEDGRVRVGPQAQAAQVQGGRERGRGLCPHLKPRRPRPRAAPRWPGQAAAKRVQALAGREARRQARRRRLGGREATGGRDRARACERAARSPERPKRCKR